jgi:hypothetical protein
MVTVQLMMAGKVGPADVELAAASISGRTNGHAKPRPPTPRLVGSELELEPAPEPPALTTAAAQVLALTANGCRWPSGDPQRPGFCFCGRPTVAQPYCARHRAAAYVAPLVDSTASKRFAHLDFNPAGSRRDLLRAIGRGGHLIEGGTEPIAR